MVLEYVLHWQTPNWKAYNVQSGYYVHLHFKRKTANPYQIFFFSFLKNLPGFGGSLGAFTRSSAFLSSPPNGDSRLSKFKFSVEDFRCFDLFSASWIRLDILLDGLWTFSTKKRNKKIFFFTWLDIDIFQSNLFFLLFLNVIFE